MKSTLPPVRQIGARSTDTLLEAMRELMQSLLPRAQAFCVYGVERDCVWRSDAAEGQEVDEFVTNLELSALAGPGPEERWLCGTLKSGRTAFLMLLTTGDGRERGFLLALFSSDESQSAAFNPSVFRKVLHPVARLIAESGQMQERVESAEIAQASVRAELDLVYDIDERVHGSSRSHSGLAQLVGKSGRFLEIAYSVLLIPGKRIRISATHSSWKAVNRRVLDRYLIDHMLPKLDGRQYPVIFEIPPMETSPDVPANGYQTMVCPIIDRYGVVEGALAQLGRINGAPFKDSDRKLMAHVGRKVEYVIEQSYDAMTGLMNMKGFEAQLGESWKTLETREIRHQLLYLDLDNLTLVNDKFGPKAGDEVVRRFAAMISEDLPPSAVQSRITGDDFCILLTDADDESARVLADTIRKRCEKLRYLEGDSSLQLTCSIGIAEFSLASRNEAQVLTAARLACESAKKHGKNRIEVYDANNQSMIRRYDDMNLVAEVQRCLDEDGFELMAQPILFLDQPSAKRRFEILLRMRDSSDQAVPAESFLSAAERYQLMPKIDRWVVSHTLNALVRHREEVERSGVRFCINLSGQSLSDDAMLRFVLTEIEASGLPASCLGFELTESAAVSNLAKAQRFIHRLHDIGCHVSLDDFGAGLSSFAYLKNFQVDTLKIDGGFVRDIVTNRISESMVAAITQVAKVMQLETVAEYVENSEIQAVVRRLGVDYAQGHNVGKPSGLAGILTDICEPECVSEG